MSGFRKGLAGNCLNAKRSISCFVVMNIVEASPANLIYFKYFIKFSAKSRIIGGKIEFVSGYLYINTGNYRQVHATVVAVFLYLSC